MTDWIDGECPSCKRAIRLLPPDGERELVVEHSAPICAWSLHEAAKPGGGVFAALAPGSAAQYQFPCVECGSTVTVQDTTPPTILHPLPMCDRFVRVETVQDAADYMRESRLKAHPESVELDDVTRAFGAGTRMKGNA